MSGRVEQLISGCPEPVWPMELSSFLGKLQACLTYQHDDFRPYGEHEELQRELENTFFQTLYVERDEHDELKACCASCGPIIVSGLPGTGKTTLLRRLLLDLSARSDVFVQYLNFAKHESDHRRFANESKDAAVCALMYWRIINEYIIPQKLSRAFDGHRLQHFSFFANLRQHLERMEEIPSATDAWIALSGRTDIAQQLKTYDDGPRDDADLLILLDFIATRVNSIYLLFDNLDGASSGTQLAVVKKCVDVLKRVCTPIVAVRSANLRLIEADDGRYGARARRINLRVAHEPGAREHLQLAGADLGHVGSIVHAFVKKRFRFLKQHLRQRDQLTPERERTTDAFEHLLGKLFELAGRSTIIAALDMWNNHSLRDTGADVAALAARIIGRVDPAFPPHLLQDPRKGSVRLARSCIFKYMICGDGLYYDPNKGVLNLFRCDEEDGQTPFKELGLLSLLVARMNPERRDAPLTFLEIRSVFAQFGITQEDTARVINRCAGGFRLVHVHTALRRLPDNEIEWQELRSQNKTVDNKLIELLPRGEFLVRSLARSCEYLFWMSYDSPVGSKRKLQYLETASDSIRLAVASNFAHERVWRKVRNVCKRLPRAAGGCAEQVAFLSRFPSTLKEYFYKTSRSLSRFEDGAYSLLREMQATGKWSAARIQQETNDLANASRQLKDFQRELRP